MSDDVGDRSGRLQAPRRMWRLAGVATVATAISAMFAARTLGDFDLPWHLATGRTIAQSHTIAAIDDFSYIHAPVHYTDVAADLVLWAVYRFGRTWGLQIFAGALAGLLLVSLWSRTERKGPLAAAALSVALQASCTWLYLRPTLLALPLASVLAGVLERYTESSHSVRRRLLPVIVFVPWLWANVHQSADLGLALIGLWVSSHWLGAVSFLRERRMVPESAPRGRLAVSLAGALAFAATWLNTAHGKYFTQPFDVAQLGDVVSEWRTTSLGFLVANEPWAILFGSLVLLSLLARPTEGRPRFTIYEIGVLVLAATLVRYLRLLPFACVLVAPMMASRLEAAAGRLRPVRLLGGVLLVANLFVVASRLEPFWGRGFDEGQLPFGAARFILRSKPAGPMWNFFPFGGTLIFMLYPEQRVLIDGRIPTVYEPSFLRQVVASSHDASAFAALDESFGFTWAVCSALEGQAECVPVARSRSWTMVYWDDLSVVYVRREGSNAALAERGYGWLRHLTPPEEVLSAAARGVAELAHDGELAVSQAPESPRAWFVAACGAMAIRDRDGFVRATASLRRLAPGHPSLDVLEQVWKNSSPSLPN